MDLVEGIYAASKQWPKEETFGLINQIRRAAVSVPANIAEGQGRRSPNEFIRFLNIATGSLHELETHLLIAQRLRFADEHTVTHLLALSAETTRIINGLIRKQRRKLAPTPDL
jgi:four helix bundle protein